MDWSEREYLRQRGLAMHGLAHKFLAVFGGPTIPNGDHSLRNGILIEHFDPPLPIIARPGERFSVWDEDNNCKIFVVLDGGMIQSAMWHVRQILYLSSLPLAAIAFNPEVDVPITYLWS